MHRMGVWLRGNWHLLITNYTSRITLASDDLCLKMTSKIPQPLYVHTSISSMGGYGNSSRI